MPFGLKPGRMLVHRAANLVEDVLQLGRLRERPRPPVLAGAVPGQLVGTHAV